MKNTFLKTIGGTMLAILMLAVFANISVSAQDTNNAEENVEQTKQDDLLNWRNGSRALEGSWNVQVTIRNCQTGAAIITFPAMNTYMGGGTMVEAGSSSTLRGGGHGVWSYQGRRTFSAAFQFFRFNADGTYAGIQRVRRQIEVSRSESNFTASAMVEIFNPSGVLIATGCATETATRFE